MRRGCPLTKQQDAEAVCALQVPQLGEPPQSQEEGSGKAKRHGSAQHNTPKSVQERNRCSTAYPLRGRGRQGLCREQGPSHYSLGRGRCVLLARGPMARPLQWNFSFISLPLAFSLVLTIGKALKTPKQDWSLFLCHTNNAEREHLQTAMSDSDWTLLSSPDACPPRPRPRCGPPSSL